MTPYRISFAGAGRVAGTLCQELCEKGHKIVQIASRERENGTSLVKTCYAEWIDNLNFNIPCDIIIVAVPDNALKEVLTGIKCADDTTVVHTAGSYGLEIFPDVIRKKGVFYPLQTFSKGRKIDFSNVPVFLEASDNEVMELLKSIAYTITTSVYESDTDKRRMLHLAAVFACNFSNHMFTLAKHICLKTCYDFDVLKPLIKETVNKALEYTPEASQTGPAVRNDTETIKKHLELLSFSQEMKKIYIELTDSITELYRIK